MNHSNGSRLQTLLGLRTAPVALCFRESPPAGVPHIDYPEASSCSYWKLAAGGKTFYTKAQDNYNCPIGAYTYGLDLPPQQAQELQGVLGTMFSLGYLRPEEVPGIPRRQAPFGVAVYAPLAEAAFEPDVVLVCGNPRQVMLLAEAAQAVGEPPPSGGGVPGLMGRPTCAAIPAALSSQRGVASLGCIGNRVYTGLSDDELYFALPGKHLNVVVEKLTTILEANRQLESYHRDRQASLSPS
jgi:uncharacterized protein (DUF169 family)